MGRLALMQNSPWQQRFVRSPAFQRKSKGVANFDPSQYGNQRGISIQHYLINMVHRILSALDNNQKKQTFAVLANFIDWNNAFPHQCPNLGI